MYQYYNIYFPDQLIHQLSTVALENGQKNCIIRNKEKTTTV